MSMIFDHNTLSQRILFGSSQAVQNTVTAVRELGAERVLLIADAFAAETSDAVAAELPVVARIHDIVQHVPDDRAAAATQLAKEQDADLVLSIGGGSATGLAKIVALRTGVPIVAVPTTFAGSEATNVWGLTEAARKRTGSDPLVLPRVIIYDATLSAGLPGEAAVASGLNALAHAVDGLWAPRANPINRAMGTEGMRALVPGLRALVADPADLDAREQTLYGAYLAAVAFASAGSGMHHKICHVLGGTFGLPHAETHAIVLPYVAGFNESAAPDAAARVSAIVGSATAGRGLWELHRELGGPLALAEVGLKESDIAEAALICAEAMPPSNPRQGDASALKSLLLAAWAGEAVA